MTARLDFPVLTHTDWQIDESGPNWQSPPEAVNQKKFVIDPATGDRYYNEEYGNLIEKMWCLAIWTPVVHPVASAVNIAMRAAGLISCFHFWRSQEDPHEDTMKQRSIRAAEDCFRIINTPTYLCGLEMAALSCCFCVDPRDARKLYGDLERNLYDGCCLLAPCFQPNPKGHLLGGDENKQGAL